MAAKDLSDVKLSVLDRLIDREPQNRQDAPVSRSLSVHLLKNAVRRDLEWLLNTRRIALELDDSLKEVNRSVYTFGLPDFSKYSMGSAADQAKLIRQLTATVKIFEPRLSSVKIVLNDAPTPVGLQEVRLRIEAILLTDPTPEPVSFDTVIELRSGTCTVGGDSSAG